MNFERMMTPCRPVGEANTLSCKLQLALLILQEKGLLAEYERLRDKFILSEEEPKPSDN